MFAFLRDVYFLHIFCEVSLFGKSRAEVASFIFGDEFIFLLCLLGFVNAHLPEDEHLSVDPPWVVS